MNDLDLFGKPGVPLPVGYSIKPGGGKKRRQPRPNGFAAPPGGGPADEFCKTCRHIQRFKYQKTFLKCALVKPTHGAGTDIRANAPACARWEKIKPEEKL